MVFGVDWPELELEDVKAFLAGSEEEGLLWEAKGGEMPRSSAVTKAVCGLANSQGGFLILGAEEEDGDWRATGLSFPGGEAATWVSSIVNTTLRPVPRFDVKAWRVSGRRSLAVVHVEALAAKPCITSGGVVYERTSGQTLPVSDPVVLGRLVDQGIGAKARAEMIARQAVEIEPAPPRLPEGPQNCLAKIGLAPVGLPDDFGSHLFNRTFATATFRECLEPHLGVGPFDRPPWRAVVTQDALTAHREGHDAAWQVRVAWDGSVSFAYSSVESETVTADLVQILHGAWRVGISVLDALRTTGPVHLSFVATPRPTRSYLIERRADLVQPSEDDLASVHRELERAQGRDQWED